MTKSQRQQQQHSLTNIQISSSISCFVVVALVAVSIKSTLCNAHNSDSHLYFSREPSSNVVFSNNSGTRIPCSANGAIEWITESGERIIEASGPRHIGPDGSLVFEPFSELEPSLHSSRVYRCRARNGDETIVSRAVTVRAVLDRQLQIEVFDEFVSAGNGVALQCHVPDDWHELTEVVAWRVELDGKIVSHIDLAQSLSSNKYRLLSSGRLLVRNVTPEDAQKSFRCEIRDRVNDRRHFSITAGRIFVSEIYANTQPKIAQHESVLIVDQGAPLVIGCVAHAHPPPRKFAWSHESQGTKRLTSANDVLVIERTQPQDAGMYRCTASNIIGHDSAHFKVIVRAPLTVRIDGGSRVKIGDNLKLNCSVSGSPKPNSVEWLHNGRLVANTAQLHLFRIDKHDMGVYQCVARNELTDSAQATVKLEVEGDDAPQLLSVFSEQTLQPGQPLSLKCIASGSPIPQVLWHVYDGLPIPDHISRYRVGDYVTRDSLLVSYVNISSLMPEDGGVYTCTATNELGQASHTGRINVFGKPSVRRMANRTAVAGESISISCPVGGFPVDVISWEREGIRLPYNHRQKVYPNGTLMITELERVTDEGTYTCVARTREDARSSARTSFGLNVLVRPVIEPFSFPKSLHQGQRYNILCTVVKGDPPVKIEWHKDGRRLTAGVLPKTNIIQVTEYSLTLAFESVEPEHRGNYSCVASNAAGNNRHDAEMIIHVPPRWNIEPIDQSIVRGRNALIDCNTDAHPPPVVTWSRAEGDHREVPSDFKPIVSNGHLRPYENGSLVIHNSHKSDSGFYMCASSNGIGAGISKVIKITVNVAAHFESKFRTETVYRGLEARIKCAATGDKPIAVSWFKDKAPFSPTVNGVSSDSMGVGINVGGESARFDLIETLMTDGIRSELLIRNADRRDGGLYTCLGTNPFGRDDTNIQLIVQEPPDPPTDIKLIERDGRTLRLAWSPPYSGNSPLMEYVVQFKCDNEKWSSLTNVTVLPVENSVTLAGLQPVTNYQIRIFAQNALGRSESSEVFVALTAEETPGAPPLHIKAAPLSSTSVKISWKPPRREFQFGAIRGYYIGYRPVLIGPSDSENYIYKTVEVKGQSALSNNKENVLVEEATISDLKRASQYEVIVQAFNSKGAGPSSEPANVKTLEFDPPLPPVIQVAEVTFNYVRLSWTTPPDQIVSGWVLHYKREAADWEEIRLPDVDTFMHEGLRCGTRYQYYLVGYNSAGNGEPSQVISARTDGTSPVAPDKNSLLSVNSTSAIVYLESFHDGGCRIANFDIMYKWERSHSWTPLSHGSLPLFESKTIHLTDLKPGGRYQLRVTAFNEAGSTEAEYSFMTPLASDRSLFGDSSAESGLMGTRIPASSSNVPFYTDILVLVPSVISFVVVVVLLSLVYVIFTRKPRNPNNSIYGNFSDLDNKLSSDASVTNGGESVIMGDMTDLKQGFDSVKFAATSNSHCLMNGAGNFQSPYAMTSMTDAQRFQTLSTSSPHKYPNGQFMSHHMGNEVYATVKRTPRPRRDDVHIYQYPHNAQQPQQLSESTGTDQSTFESPVIHSQQSCSSNPWHGQSGCVQEMVYETEMTRMKMPNQAQVQQQQQQQQQQAQQNAQHFQ